MNYSVLISVYEKVLPNELDLALYDIYAQTILPSQVVIVIDGYISEELNKIINKYSYIKKIKNTIVKLEQNVGLGSALKIGVEKCTNEYVMRMDADDRCEKNRAEILINFIKENNVHIVGSSIIEFNDKSERRLVYQNFTPGEKIFNYKRDPVGHASCILKKSSVIEAGNYLHLPYFEDTYLWLRMAKLGYSFHSIDIDLYRARIDNGFIDRRRGLKYISIELKAFIRFKKEKLISLNSFIINIITRPLIRIMPSFVNNYFYNFFLRSKKT